jgi:hypothetical protein
VHRLGREALDHRSAWDDDALVLQQLPQQIAGIRGRQCSSRQPAFQLRLERAREVAVAEPALDCRKLVVAGRSTAGEGSNDAGVDPDLLGDMVEHNGGQQLAAAQVATGIAESAQLQCV